MARLLGSAALALICVFGTVRHGVFSPEAYTVPPARPSYSKNSLYHRIFVYEAGSVVTLQFGKRKLPLVQSQVDRRDMRRHMLEYSMLAFAALLYNPEPEKVLVLGLGGGVIPREMHYYFPNLDVDVVEIDREVQKIAEQFFGFRQDDRLRVHVADGRMFIKRLLRHDPVPKYDIIILDAFNSDYIPFHLMTKEFLQEVRSVLADSGVVIANVFYANRLFDAELKTFLAVFSRCQVFFGAQSSNAILAAPGPAASVLTVKEATERANALQKKREFAFDLAHVAGRLRPQARPGKRAVVLTDDRAPVNWLRRQKSTNSQGPSQEAGEQPAQMR